MTTTASEGRSDEEWRKLLLPALTIRDVEVLLRENMDTFLEIGVTEDSPERERSTDTSMPPFRVIQQLDSYDDNNFMVQIHGKVFLLKVHNGVESRDLIQAMEEANGEFTAPGKQTSCIHLQNAMMQHLTDAGIATNVPQTTRNSHTKTPPCTRSPWIRVKHLPVLAPGHSPCPLVVRLLSWIEGKPMSTVNMLPIEALTEAGRFLGRVDQALDQFLPQADASLALPARRYHQWDGKNTLDLRPFIKYIQHDQRREIVESIVDTFEQKVIPMADKFRCGMNHGDFNDANIIVNSDLQVCGIIDFGDSTESWRVLDVSVAMAYAMLSVYAKNNLMISGAAAFLRGYHHVYPLTPLEREHLPLLVACRLACSATLGAYSFQLNPENEYLLLHSAPAWRALELLWPLDAAERLVTTTAIRRVWDRACDADVVVDGDVTTGVIRAHDLVFPDPTVDDLLASARQCPERGLGTR